MKKLVLGALCLVLGAGAVRAEGPEGEKGMTIYFTNDIHTHVDNDPAKGASAIRMSPG